MYVTVYDRTIRLNKASRLALGNPTTVSIHHNGGCGGGPITSIEYRACTDPAHAFPISPGGSVRDTIGFGSFDFPQGKHKAELIDGRLVVANPTV